MTYLSRLTIRRDPDINALRDLIDPNGHRGARTQDRAMDAHHRLLWSAFSDSEERRRDFLWRAEGNGRFLVLSARPPEPASIFQPPETKPFDVSLAPGDRLRFTLRANAVAQLAKDPNDRSKPSVKHPKGRVRSRKVDVAMKVLHDVPARDLDAPGAHTPGSTDGSSRRAKAREQVARQEAFAWLAKQGAAYGFEPAKGTFLLEGYRTVTLPSHRGKRRGEPRFGVFDMTGVLTVREPDAFLDKLGRKLDAGSEGAARSGFGRAKAFGCGLMLIRRA